MKRIVLFRFSKEPEICKNRLELIGKLNPGVPIYGIFGGEESEENLYKEALESYFANFYTIRNQASKWKWKNVDLALRDWYKSVGQDIDFDLAHLIEWDLLITTSLEKAYGGINKGEIGITALVPLESVESKWYWTSEEPSKTEWENLLKFAKEKYGYNQNPFASLGPGTCYPKEFLEKYSKVEVPELCHDELRVPLFAQICGIPIKDTGFYRSWSDAEEEKIFNCEGQEIEMSLIEEKTVDGSRVAFHPFRKLF